MAKCKYCGEEISRLDKEICPFCGGKRPLEEVDNTTQDVTKALETLQQMGVEPKSKSKILAAILAFFLGIFGAHNYYLGKHKIGLITLGISIVSIAGIGSILYFAALHNIFAYLIPYFVIEALMIVVAISFLIRPDISDANGDFLK